MVEFGEQLKRAREEKGMTQQTLADELFVTRQSVSHWECGDRYPDIPTTKKISEILDVSLDNLLSGKDMTKVIERNPVIENKWANNALIAIYAFVVFSRLLQLIDVVSASIPSFNLDNYIKLYPYAFIITLIEILKIVLIIAIFSYGLFTSVGGNLTPKKAGTTIVAYFAVVFACNLIFNLAILSNSQWDASLFKLNILDWSYYLIAYAVGAVSAYFYFIHNNNKKICPILLMLVCSVMILRKIIETVQVFSYTEPDITPYHNSITSLAVDMLPSIMIYSLIIFQVVVLYKKRKTINTSNNI